MAEVIQFNCPACGTLLRLPLTLAAQQGPCPCCQQEIVAPDPYRGIGGMLALSPQEPEVEISQPYAESPQVIPIPSPEGVEKSPEPEELALPVVVETPATPAIPTPGCARQPRAVLVLSCLLAGAVGLAMGYAFGVRSKPNGKEASAIPSVVNIPQPESRVTEPPIPVSIPVPQPDPLPAEVPKPAPPSMKASAAAEASLRAFLDAPDWASRSAHVLSPAKTRTAMEAYSHEVPDGPTEFKSISVKQSQLDENTGTTLFIFLVVTEKFPDGIPVAVKETASGWLVDWLTFVEFRDGLFQSFVDGPADKAGFFHLIVRLPEAQSGDNNGNGNFTSYFIQSPLADKAQLAFVRKRLPAAAALQLQTENGKSYAPVLEVVKRKTPDQRDYFEILSVKADDWFPME